jgi:hypothetical protein
VEIMMNRIVELLEMYQQDKNRKYEEFLEIYEFVIENQQSCSMPLYRGLKNIKTPIEVGQKFASKNLVESFTEDIDTAISFASANTIIPVVLCIEEPVGLPIYIYTENENESEWLIPDQEFVVSSIKNTKEYIIVYLAAVTEINLRRF